MKIHVLIIVFVSVAYVKADCGCLKCSKHLQGVDLTSLCSHPVKVIIKKPPGAGGGGCCSCCGCSGDKAEGSKCSCGCGCPCCGASNKPKEETECCYKTLGEQYTATVQVPVPKYFSKSRPPLFSNLKYKTDTVLVPTMPSSCCSARSTPDNPSLPSNQDIINWLNYLIDNYSEQCADIPTISLPSQKCKDNSNSGGDFSLRGNTNSNYECQRCRGNSNSEGDFNLRGNTNSNCECQACRGNRGKSNSGGDFNLRDTTNSNCECQEWRGNRGKSNSGGDFNLRDTTNSNYECQACRGNSNLGTTNQNSQQKSSCYACSSCQRSKRSITLPETVIEKPTGNTHNYLNRTDFLRSKRDLGNRGYNFVMNMVPQYIREPLHHSIQGNKYLQGSNFKQKPNGLNYRNVGNIRSTNYHNFKAHSPYYPPQQAQPFSSISQSPFLQSSLFQQSQNNKPSLKTYSDYANPLYLNGLKKGQQISLTEQADSFGRTKKLPKLSLLKQGHPLENQQYSSPDDRTTKSLLFGKSKISSFNTPEPLTNNQYQMLLQNYGLQPASNTPTFSQRLKEKEGNEKTLLRKLKKLNNNPFKTNLEDQATTFVQKLLNPEETKYRRKRFAENNLDKKLARNRRTIILGSEEIDLPPHYEVELVSEEDEDEHVESQQPGLDYSEEVDEEYEDIDDEDNLVGESPFQRKLALNRKLYSRLPTLQPKPEILLGKTVIQKAVREELDAYHKKLSKEQKIKEMKENLQRKKQPHYSIPQNPIFAILTAPVKFLRHFHDLNRGVNPVMTSLPKLVYTTKKVFKDLGKNFHRNCLDLASNVMGDFDQVHPSVVQRILNPDDRRYKRDVLKNDPDKNPSNGKENGILKENANGDSWVFPNDNRPTAGCNGSLSQKHDLQEIADKNTTNNSFEATSSHQYHFEPVYTLAFDNHQGTQNFCPPSDKYVRKKRYVVRVVDDGDMQEQVEAYLKQNYPQQYQNYNYNPLQDYLTRLNEYIKKAYENQQTSCKYGEECYYHQSTTNYPPPAEETHDAAQDSESLDDSSEEKPKKRKLVIKKFKPKVIIDNKGRPFMEYNGYKRPLRLHGKRSRILRKSDNTISHISSNSYEETGNKIATLIARAKEDTEVVGNAQKDVATQQILKERISSLLEEIDQLVHLNADNYDEIFEELIKIQHIKHSIEQDWKRMLMDNKVNDIGAKINLLSKFKDLQHAKDLTVKKIAAALRKNDNEFLRCQLVNNLKILQKLQCLITSVVEDFEQHLKMKTQFNIKKEIKYVDYLSDLKFAAGNTRNDLLKKLCNERDSEGQKNIEVLNKLKKLLNSADGNSDKVEQAAKILWEMNNTEKMQIETIKEMNKKLSKNYKIRKELKILFDLQKRFEDCKEELGEFLGGNTIKLTDNKVKYKKDIKEIIAEIKKRHEEMLLKAKEKSNMLKKS